MGVSRETLAGLAERYDLRAASEPQAGAPAGRARVGAATCPPPSGPGRTRSGPTWPTPSRGSRSEALRAAARTADLGAGAGFPGLVLAAALPDARVDLIEATARKAAVAARLAEAAGIANATAVTARAEEWGAGPPGRRRYEAVTARAVGPAGGAGRVRGAAAAPGRGARGVEGRALGGRGARRAPRPPRARPRGGGRSSRLHRSPGARSRHLHVLRKVAPTPPGVPAAARAWRASAPSRSARSIALGRSAGGGANRSPANLYGEGALPTGRAPTLARAWETSWQSQIRRAAWARPPPP